MSNSLVYKQLTLQFGEHFLLSFTGLFFRKAGETRDGLL